jgi:hypothetical protein
MSPASILNPASGTSRFSVIALVGMPLVAHICNASS